MVSSSYSGVVVSLVRLIAKSASQLRLASSFRASCRIFFFQEKLQRFVRFCQWKTVRLTLLSYPISLTTPQKSRTLSSYTPRLSSSMLAFVFLTPTRTVSPHPDPLTCFHVLIGHPLNCLVQNLARALPLLSMRLLMMLPHPASTGQTWTFHSPLCSAPHAKICVSTLFSSGCRQFDEISFSLTRGPQYYTRMCTPFPAAGICLHLSIFTW